MPRSSHQERLVSVGLFALGCCRNLVDAEVFLGDLATHGYAIAADPADADVVLVNTCGFIDRAREESLAAIREAVRLKRTGRARAVIVTGCMAQRHADALRAEVAGIDAIVSLSSQSELATVVGHLGRAPRRRGKGTQALDDGCLLRPPARTATPDVGRLRLTPGHYAYVKVGEGCSNPCSFCIIPRYRGAFRSKPIEDCVREVEELVGSGAAEIVLIGEDTTGYGRDLYGRPSLGDLLRRLAEVPGLRWLRLLYAHPAHLDADTIAALRVLPQACRYLDLPMQHVTTPLLERMRRGLTGADLDRLVAHLRSEIPDLVLRTTFLVGFPGETEDDHAALLAFVRTHRIERVGAFVWSPQAGTPAARMPDAVPEPLREERLAELLRVQQEIAFAHARGRVGREALVVVDGPGEGTGVVARSEAEAPEVDPVILLPGTDLPPGDLLRVRLVDAEGYDLIAEPIEADGAGPTARRQRTGGAGSTPLEHR